MGRILFDLVVRVEIDDQQEPDVVAAAVDAMRFAHRHLLNHDKRMRDAFAATIVGSQARRVRLECDRMGCVNDPLVGEEAAA